MHSASSKSAFDYSEEFAHVLALIEDAQSIALSGHTSPDGDALGSVLGLGLAIQKRYPEKQVAFLLADDAPVPRIYRFLAGSDSLVPACRYTDTPDLFISVDCPVLDRLADAAGVAKRARTSVCFDHHPARTEFADVVVRCVGAAAVAFFLPRYGVGDWLAVSSGFGYYSLSGILITELRGSALGTLALLYNIFRELRVILCAPLLCRLFGPLAPICQGGATSGDTTLPVIAAACGRQFVPLSIYHGICVDFTVPFLVPFFCGAGL